MNSLPTISQLKDDEFEQQWAILKDAFKVTNINMEVVLLITQAVIQISNAGGFGSIQISMLNNFIQEITLKQTKRSALFVVRGQEPPPVPTALDNLDSV